MTVYAVTLHHYEESWIDTIHATNDGAVARKLILEAANPDHVVDVQPYQVEGVA